MKGSFHEMAKYSAALSHSNYQVPVFKKKQTKPQQAQIPRTRQKGCNPPTLSTITQVE